MEESVRGRKIPDKMGGKEAELLGKIKITLWPNSAWRGGGSFHSMCLTCLRHTNTTAMSTIRSAVEHGTARSEGNPARHPALGGPAALSPHMQERESSSTVLRAPTPV